MGLLDITFVKMPRPGNNTGDVSIRVELVSAWAPSTERDAKTHTDIWCGHKLTVALPFAEVDRIFGEAAALINKEISRFTTKELIDANRQPD